VKEAEKNKYIPDQTILFKFMKFTISENFYRADLWSNLNGVLPLNVRKKLGKNKYQPNYTGHLWKKVSRSLPYNFYLTITTTHF